jgi:hypothetical protein
MGRQTCSPEFKLEAIKLVRERGVRIGQAAKDLGLHENVLRKLTSCPARTSTNVGQCSDTPARGTHFRFGSYSCPWNRSPASTL